MVKLTLKQRIERAVFRGSTQLPPSLARLLAGKPIVRQGRTLDAQAQLGLRLERLAGAKQPHELDVATARYALEVSAAQVAGPPAQPVRVQSGRLADRPVRIYRPDGLASPAPALLYMHGGGHVVGSLDSHDDPCRELAVRARCVVVSLDYRLAPEHRFPAALDDAVAATRALLDEADGFGVDAARVGVAGDSAGGNLAAVVSIETRADAKRPAFQMLVYPVVDMTMSSDSIESFGSGFFLERETIAWYRDHYLGDADRRDPRASPLFAEDLSGLPPALVITAGFDPLHDEGQAYAERLRDAGVTVTHHDHAGLFHGFWNASSLIEAADRGFDDAARVVRKQLGS